MAKQSWLLKTYKQLGLNDNQLYTLWFILFIGLSILYSYCYFLLWVSIKFLLTMSPLIYIVLTGKIYKKFVDALLTNSIGNKESYVFVLICIQLFLFIFSQILEHSPHVSATVGSGGFYILPTLFCVGWLLNAKPALAHIFRAVNQEWWLDIQLEGMFPDYDDIKVDKKGLDDFLKIYGEPKTWLEQRFADPESLALLSRLKSNGTSCTLTAKELVYYPPDLRKQVWQWQQHLNKHPPTPQDWKDSGFDFSTPAKDKATAASHPGSPIAVPSLTGEDT
jgi:hypothetical protein